jgi:fumarate reductase subunit D
MLLLIILILLLLGALPTYPYSRAWGYGPSGLVGVLLVVLIVLLMFQAVPWGFTPVPVDRPVVVP